MIHSLTITNPKNETLELELAHPEKSGLIVTKVEGLGPPQATINGQEIATSDGMIYSSARAEARNVVLYLKMFSRDLNSPYGPLSIEESRHLTYQYFPLKKEITIHIRTDARTVYCKGYIESNLPDIFSNEEGCQISVICTDPWLYTEGDEKTVFSGIHGIFEFPFSNESLTMTKQGAGLFLQTYGVSIPDDEEIEIRFRYPKGTISFSVTNESTLDYITLAINDVASDFGYVAKYDAKTGAIFCVNQSNGAKSDITISVSDTGEILTPKYPLGIDKVTDTGEKLIEFGQIWLDTRAILNYKGTVDTGILITIHAFDTAEKIRIYNVDTREQMIIDTEKIRTITGKEYGEKDDIIISTVKGNRYCRLLRAGTYTNIIGALSKDTDWFQISAGNNGFAFAAEKGADNLSVTFSYQNAYVGV